MEAGNPIRGVEPLPQAVIQVEPTVVRVPTTVDEAKPDSMAEGAMDAALDPFAELNRND